MSIITCKQIRTAPISLAAIILYTLFVAIVNAGTFEDRTAKWFEGSARIANGGCSFGDFDDDGFVDAAAGSQLWRNKDGKRFVLDEAPCGDGVWGDWDNDGFLDRYRHPGGVYRYLPDKKAFELIKLYEGEMDSAASFCWGDYNGDGRLDVYTAGVEGGPARDMLLLNENGRKFVKTFERGGLYGRGVTACDFDQDNDLDIYVTNYRLQPNYLWQNDGKGNLSDVAASYNATGGHGHGIGSCWGDVDNDGYFDLFAGNFAHPWGDQPHSKFLRNLGPDGHYKFEDKGEGGVHYQESYACPTLGDYDNDGDLDIYFTTVYGTASYGIKNYPALYRNDGNWTFTNVTAEAGLSEIGATYQAAWADVDNDGDLDLMTASRLFINTGNDNHWLKIRLKGDGRTVNRSAIGAQVRIRIGKKVITRQVQGATGGHANQNDMTLHFGLGAHDARLTYEITWPNGQVQQGVAEVDRMITVEYNGAQTRNLSDE